MTRLARPRPPAPVAVAALGAAWVVAAPALPAQATATLEGGVSRVHYDGFHPAGAASLASAVALRGGSAAVSARGSYLRFESGNSTWQATLAGSVFAPRLGPSRPEIWATAGASRYVDFRTFWHAIGGARLHVPVARGTAWVDGSIGRTSFGGRPQPVAMVGAGVWTRRYGPTVTLAASYVGVGDTTYTDLQGTTRARWRAIELGGVLGARLWSRGGGHGVYGEASLAIIAAPRAAFVLAGGRYPTDPTQGTISGNYAYVGVRLSPLVPGAQPPAPTPPPGFTASGSSSSGENGATTWLELHPEARGTVRLVVHAPTAVQVEVAGDFTQWQPLALTLAAHGRWEVAVRIPRGLHRINVRIGGGPWFAPVGTTRSADDYGGETGIFVVP